MQRIYSLASISCLVFGLSIFGATGCGSSRTPPAEGADSAAEKGDAGEEARADSPEEAELEAEGSTEPEGPILNRPAEDILSEPGNAWVFNYQSSQMYEDAGERCDARFGDKPKERASCMSQARSSFIADAMEFKKNPSGQDVWVIYRSKGNRLIQIYSIPISYGEEKAGVMKVKKAGSAKGSPPLFASAKEFDVKLLSSYSMELNDPQHGRLTYDARIGFISK